MPFVRHEIVIHGTLMIVVCIIAGTSSSNFTPADYSEMVGTTDAPPWPMQVNLIANATYQVDFEAVVSPQLAIGFGTIIIRVDGDSCTQFFVLVSRPHTASVLSPYYALQVGFECKRTPHIRKMHTLWPEYSTEYCFVQGDCQYTLINHNS
jgi:hypothetical protein